MKRLPTHRFRQRLWASLPIRAQWIAIDAPMRPHVKVKSQGPLGHKTRACLFDPHDCGRKNPGLCRSKYSSGRLGRAHPSWTLQVCTCLSKCGWSANDFYHRTVLAQANCQTKDAAPPWNFLPLQAPPLLPLAFGLRPGLLHSIPPCLTFTKKGNGIFPLYWPDLTSNSVQLTRFFVRRLDSLTAVSTCKLPTPCWHCQVIIFAAKKLWEILM